MSKNRKPLVVRGNVIEHTRADMDSHYAVIPCATRQEARAVAAFHSMLADPKARKKAVRKLAHKMWRSDWRDGMGTINAVLNEALNLWKP